VSGVNGQGLGKVPECRFHGLVMPGERPDPGGVAGVAAQRGGEVAAAADPAGAGSPTERSTPMTSDTTGHLNLRLMVVVYDAIRCALAHPPRAASHRPAELDELVRRTAMLAGWELFKTQLHIHHTALEAL
jgi:hypothetical protein